MNDAKTILVPVDFQDASVEALALARELGEKLGMEVVLLHVFTIPLAVYPGIDPIINPGLAEEIGAAANKAVEQLAAASDNLRFVVRPGEPAQEILAVVTEMQPAFVVMGTHGRKGLSHLVMGSVAERVVRGSPVPVITVRARPTK